MKFSSKAIAPMIDMTSAVVLIGFAIGISGFRLIALTSRVLLER
jgi:hypothetical protein